MTGKCDSFGRSVELPEKRDSFGRSEGQIFGEKWIQLRLPEGADELPFSSAPSWRKCGGMADRGIQGRGVQLRAQKGDDELPFSSAPSWRTRRGMGDRGI